MIIDFNNPLDNERYSDTKFYCNGRLLEDVLYVDTDRGIALVAEHDWAQAARYHVAEGQVKPRFWIEDPDSSYGVRTVEVRGTIRVELGPSATRHQEEPPGAADLCCGMSMDLIVQDGKIRSENLTPVPLPGRWVSGPKLGSPPSPLEVMIEDTKPGALLAHPIYGKVPGVSPPFDWYYRNPRSNPCGEIPLGPMRGGTDLLRAFLHLWNPDPLLVPEFTVKRYGLQIALEPEALESYAQLEELAQRATQAFLDKQARAFQALYDESPEGHVNWAAVRPIGEPLCPPPPQRTAPEAAAAIADHIARLGSVEVLQLIELGMQEREDDGEED